MTIEEKKYKLFHLIDKVQSEKEIDSILVILEKYQKNLNTIIHLIKPIQQKTDILQIMQTQHYQGADFAKMQVLIKEMDIQEPIEELIASIT